MNGRYKMSVEENIFYAKRNIVDSIYREAKLEGIAVTFPETLEIYEGRTVSGVSVEDTVKINNLKRAWQFVLNTIDCNCSLLYIRQINQFVQAGITGASPGVIRNFQVSIGGTAWKPEIPDAAKAQEKISEIMSESGNPANKAVTLMLYLMRAQLFGDGNKRTAQIAANQVMIQNGQGIISLPAEKTKEFTEMLVKFYETDDMSELKQFIYENCIDGIEHLPE